MKKEIIAVVVYGRIEFWRDRAKAIKFYKEGVQCCEGCEAERYANILCDLIDGKVFCSDDGRGKEAFIDCQIDNRFMVFSDGTNFRDNGKKLASPTNEAGARYKRLITSGESIKITL